MLLLQLLHRKMLSYTGVFHFFGAKISTFFVNYMKEFVAVKTYIQYFLIFFFFWVESIFPNLLSHIVNYLIFVAVIDIVFFLSIR